MTKERFLKMLYLVFTVDKRLQVHTYSEVETNRFAHVDKKCARCCAIEILDKNK